MFTISSFLSSHYPAAYAVIIIIRLWRYLILSQGFYVKYSEASSYWNFIEHLSSGNRWKVSAAEERLEIYQVDFAASSFVTRSVHRYATPASAPLVVGDHAMMTQAWRSQRWLDWQCRGRWRWGSGWGGRRRSIWRGAGMAGWPSRCRRRRPRAPHAREEVDGVGEL
jgi:hypothetical protein